MIRFFQYFKGMHIRDGRIHVAYTGIDIKPDAAFWRSARSVLKIYTYFRGRTLKNIITRPPSQGKIAFYPQTPGPWYNIWQVSRLARLKTVSDMRKADYIFIFEDKSEREYDPNIPQAICDETGAAHINNHILSITKSHVADVFEAVFKYPLRIDPTQHEGRAIKKSDSNGTHDGAVITCPIDPSAVEPGQVYQRLVDSTFNGKTSEDLRLAIAMGQIALVYHKHKPLDDRFGTHYLSVDVLSAEDAFSDEEIEHILTFCGKMRLDYGAIDVMRDKHDGRIYIVDVNKTCMPVLSLTLDKQIECQQKIADTMIIGLERKRGND